MFHIVLEPENAVMVHFIWYRRHLQPSYEHILQCLLHVNNLELSFNLGNHRNCPDVQCLR